MNEIRHCSTAHTTGSKQHGQVASATQLKHQTGVLSRLCRYVDVPGTRLHLRRARGAG